MTKICVVTHGGKYHADDVFTVATLELLLDPRELAIIRTRDQKLIDQADYVVDVGGLYDPEKKRFDHHMREGAGVRENGIPYASFGLVWKEYGEKLCDSKQAAEYIDTKLIQPIDGPDNSIEIYDECFLGVAPYTIQAVLTAFRPTWKEEMRYDDVFIRMVALAKHILKREIETAGYYIEAVEIIRAVYHSTKDKQIIIFGKDHSFGREMIVNVLAEYPEPMAVVLFRPDQRNWQTAVVPKTPHTMEARKSFPDAWCGKKDEALTEASGISGALVCHRTGFMIISKLREDAIALAQKALEA